MTNFFLNFSGRNYQEMTNLASIEQTPEKLIDSAMYLPYDRSYEMPKSKFKIGMFYTI